MSWNQNKILDVAIIGDGAHASIRRAETGVPYLTSKNFKADGLDLTKLDFISELDYQKHFKEQSKALTKPQENDLVVGIIGTLGSPYLVRNTDRFGLSSSVAIIRPDYQKILPKYLLYWMKSPTFQHSINQIKSGVAQSFLSLGMIGSLPVNYPQSLDIQQKIAGILTTYDDLIENNLKRIKLLEEMAQVTYQEWFVRRRINGSSISDENIRYAEMKELISDYKNGGWGKEAPEGRFTEEGYVIRGTDIPDILSGDFNFVPKRFHTQSNLEPRALINGDIIIEMSNGNMGNVGRSLYYDDSFNTILDSKVMCASFCKMARAKNIGYSYLVDAHIKYIHKNNQMLVYKSQGANGINNFQFEQMIEEEIINIPENKQALDELISYFDGIYKNLSVLRKQIHFLKGARDILLPRLMTGIIDVKSYDPAQLLKEAA